MDVFPSFCNTLSALIDSLFGGMVIDFGVIQAKNHSDKQVLKVFGANLSETIGSVFALLALGSQQFAEKNAYAELFMLACNALDLSATISAAATSECFFIQHLVF